MRYTRILPSALAIAANMVSSSLAAPIASMLSSAPRAASNISLAPPSPSLTARIKRKDMRSCTVKDHLLWVSYSVWIGTLRRRCGVRLHPGRHRQAHKLLQNVSKTPMDSSIFGVCLAYLADVKTGDNLEAFKWSEWFRRGWTLQELVAPWTVVFLKKMMGSNRT